MIEEPRRISVPAAGHIIPLSKSTMDHIMFVLMNCLAGMARFGRQATSLQGYPIMSSSPSCRS